MMCSYCGSTDVHTIHTTVDLCYFCWILWFVVFKAKALKMSTAKYTEFHNAAAQAAEEFMLNTYGSK